MREHLEVCPACSTWDHRVRRSLLLARNHLRTIEPSAEFSKRLASRLATERQTAAWPVAREPRVRLRRVVVVAIALTVVGAASVSFSRAQDVASTPLLPVVVSTPSAAETMQLGLPDAKPAFLASMSTGMAILPALMLAEEIPMRRTSSDGSGVTLRTAGLTYQNPEQH